LNEPITRISGRVSPRPAFPTATAVLWGAVGGFVAMTALALIGLRLEVLLLLGSFGASCVLLFGFPEVPFAQPANCFIGHVMSAAIGLAVLQFFGPQPWALGLAVGLAIAAMMVTRTVHPPAGSNPVIVFLAHPGWGFLLFPVVTGAALLVLIAVIYNAFIRRKAYPTYW
jgi:CBS-domain-containing membrane protein